MEDPLPLYNNSETLNNAPSVDRLAGNNQPADSSESPYIQTYNGAGVWYKKGTTFMDSFDNNPFSEEQKANVFYPFFSQSDWEIGSWLFNSGLSIATINKFLLLELVRLCQ